jgi:CheY-like chemotaxis protein
MDDRVSSLEVRRTMLSQMGYEVLIASDPPCALAIMDKVEVDLVILDYSFPGQMNGEQLAGVIRRALSDGRYQAGVIRRALSGREDRVFP